LGLYWLKWGAVAIYRPSALGSLLIRQRSAGDLFGYVSLMGSADHGIHQTQAVALSASEVWFVPQAVFHQLMQRHPEFERLLNTLLVQDLNAFSARIAQEEQRIQGLRDYLQPIPSQQAVWGQSKVTTKLKTLVEQAAASLQPVVLQGAAGTGKTFLAGIIHRQSSWADQPFAEVDCAQLPRLADGRLDTDALFGRGEQPGLLELLERGTLLISQAQRLGAEDRDRLLHYSRTGHFLRNSQPDGASDSTTSPGQTGVRLMFATPETLPWPAETVISLKLPSLTQRKADIPAFADHFLAQWCQAQNRPVLTLDQTDRRRLLSYAYPGNLTELSEILYRAVIMTPLGQTAIPEQALWSVQSAKNAFRIDLLTQVPGLRRALLSRWYPEGLWVAMMAVFVPVTLAGFLGPQGRDDSVTLNLFWAWWWPGYLFLFVFVGRLWCAVCPFMITAEGLRRLSLWLWPRQQWAWPTRWLNRWGAWLLFLGFAVIYLWEKLWDLPHHAYLSAWLLLAITAGAVIASLIYERRLWCRYLCPIGGMNGLFAKLAMVELRSTQQVCGSQCSTFGCYKGSGATPITFADALPQEGQATGGCPLYSHPAQLPNNRDCVLCMTCLKACPNRSVQLNLRFPSSDILDNHQGTGAEAALLLLLLGGVFMHHGQQILADLGLPPWPLDADHLLTSAPLALALLSLPALALALVHGVSRWIDPQQPDYVTVAYAYLPFTLALNLAHYIPAATTEAGQILVVIARSMGHPNLPLPTLTWSPDVAAFLQGVTILSALVFSLYPLRRITQRPWWANLPHVGLMVSLTLAGFWLMV
jgi:transcriptional regulator with AAA-type ATPase domain